MFSFRDDGFAEIVENCHVLEFHPISNIRDYKAMLCDTLSKQNPGSTFSVIKQFPQYGTNKVILL